MDTLVTHPANLPNPQWKERVAHMEGDNFSLEQVVRHLWASGLGLDNAAEAQAFAQHCMSLPSVVRQQW